MLRKFLVFSISLGFSISLAAAVNPTSPPTQLSAAEIVAKNAAARGGLQAWRAVQTLSLQGKMGVGGNRRGTLAVPMPNPKQLTLPQRPTEEAQLPFLMELKRGRKMRFELQFAGKTAIQLYDGASGWKLRPFLNRMEVEPYTAEELKIASTQPELDGPLLDYAAKGSRIELDGVEKVEGRDTYKLKVMEKTGHTFHVWVDAESFLEAKTEGPPRRLDGTDHPVEVYFRDYRAVDGLRIPFVLETRVVPVARTVLGRDIPAPPERIVIDKVVVNPKFDEKLFSKLELPTASKSK